MNTRNTDNLRVLMRVSYSENNRYGTYALTAKNHLAYCLRHNYTYMAVNEPYSMYNDFQEISEYLKTYDMVYTCDSDIFITDQSVPVQNFALNYVNFGQEDWCPVQFSLANGGFLIFYKKDNGIFDYLSRLAQFQDECKKIKANDKRVQFMFKGKSNNILYNMPAWAEYGTQSVFNMAYLFSKSDLISGMNMIPSGILQSYLPEYIHYGFNNMFVGSMWNKSKFLIHLIGLRPGHKVFKKKADVIEDFLIRYPEYRCDNLISDV